MSSTTDSASSPPAVAPPKKRPNCMRMSSDMCKEAAKLEEEEIEGPYVYGKSKEPVPTIGEVYGEEYAELVMRKTRKVNRKFVQKWRDEYGEDPPHMRQTPVETVPKEWKMGDPPLGLARSLELAPIKSSCVIQ